MAVVNGLNKKAIKIKLPQLKKELNNKNNCVKMSHYV